MKERNLCILRLGSPSPVTTDVEAIIEIIDGDQDKMDVTNIGSTGVIYFVRTSLTAKEVSDIMVKVEKERRDNIPHIVFNPKDMANIGFHMNVDHVERKMNEFEEKFGEFERTGDAVTEKVDLSLDDILDKINREGMDSLTSAELALLKNQK